MNAKEIREVDGGNPLGWLLSSILYDLVTDWRGVSDAFEEGYNETR